MTVSRLNRVRDAIEVLDAANYDKPYFVPSTDKDELKICRRLTRLGFLEKDPTSNHFRRTLAGEELINALAGKRKGT